ncbi:ciliary-associated calcium-binding coiled-coil protein 1 [Bufo bufo]|uniref:ciliary-associated calcium-binding coiled-coil protein 1 n=1 Tax=Bufo bufo TaxID=8384 RepID=UPI001ABE7193|nr:ciliary-associated calcium-binding coiled-coil protein 1 [Bufo bufo]
MATQEENVSERQDEVPADQLENFSIGEFLSPSQINALMEVEDVDEIQRLMEGCLNVEDPEMNLKEAVLVDYYVSGLCWGKDRNFNLQQLSGLMGLLHLLMENLQDRRLSLEENILQLTRALTGIGDSMLKDKGKLTVLNVDQAKDIISYFKISLFQHYRLYECMFTVPRDQIVVGAEQIIEIAKPAQAPFPVPLEEGIPCEIYSKFLSPPVPKEDTEPVEVEINEQLRVQEEAFTSKIENLQKP